MVEAAITIFLQILLKKLGLVNSDIQIPFLKNFDIGPIELCAFLLVIGCVRSLGTFLVCHSATITNESMNARLRLSLLFSLLKGSNSNFVHSSDINLKIGEVFPKAARFCETSAGLAVNTLIATSMAILMFYYSWREAAIGIFGLSITGIFVLIINKVVSKASLNIPLSQKKLLSGIERVARNWLLVKILRTNTQEYESLKQNVVNYTASSFRTSFYTYFGAALPPLLGIGILVLILLFHLINPAVDGAGFLSFLYLFIRFCQYIGSIANLLGSSVTTLPQFKLASEFFANIDVNHVKEAFDPLEGVNARGDISNHQIFELASIPERLTPLEPIEQPPSISIENLSFSYSPETASIISNLSINVPSGHQFSIVGRSGTGKSTLLGLILGILKPTEGRVTIDGTPPERYFSSHNSRIGYVGSEPFLIQGTIQENLEYGLNTRRDETECWDALRKARVDNVVRDLSLGLQHRLTESSEGLSTGQKQRLSLARAFLAKPMILVLDEASANLDDQTESEIAESIVELKGTCTVLIVSHKPGIMKFSDQILKMESLSQNQLI